MAFVKRHDVREEERIMEREHTYILVPSAMAAAEGGVLPGAARKMSPGRRKQCLLRCYGRAERMEKMGDVKGIPANGVVRASTQAVMTRMMREDSPKKGSEGWSGGGGNN